MQEKIRTSTMRDAIYSDKCNQHTLGFQALSIANKTLTRLLCYPFVARIHHMCFSKLCERKESTSALKTFTITRQYIFVISVLLTTRMLSQHSKITS